MSEDILAKIGSLIRENGPLGVTELAKLSGIAPNTLQRYLTQKQNYFQKNSDRKWDYPETAVKDSISQNIDNFNHVLDTQVEGVQAVANMLVGQIESLSLVIRSYKPITTTVVGIDSKFVALDRKIKDIEKLYKSYLLDFDNDHKHLLKNLDLVALVIGENKTVVNEDILPTITAYLVGKTSVLSQEVIDLLAQYQKE